MKSKTIELLAPAGSWEALEAAINAGADAVYFGGTAFGARQYANNFNREEIGKAVFFAHLHRVRLYVTVNTLVDDSEMEDMIDYLIFLSNVGIDGIIVQDLGIIEIARKVVPDLPLHASTQMTITNSEGAEFAHKAGMERVVLARECSLQEIREICEKSSAEVEVFIHGALCVCYSGQCLMSSLIGGRSGNRGRCAQPCRLPYNLVNEKGEVVLDGQQAGQYLLSPRDMNTLDILPELIKAGVASYKIEGRMKRPEYVAVVVDIYRRAIDSYLNGDYTVSEEDKLNIRQIFNRDFTTGFLEGHPGKEMMSDRRPNNRGVLVGRVTRLNRKDNKAVVKLENEVHLGDGLEFWITVGGRVGTTINVMTHDGQVVDSAAIGEQVEIDVPKGVKLNDRVFRTFDSRLMNYAQQFCGEGGKKRIPVNASVSARLGEPMKISLVDDEGNCGYGETDFIVENARKHPLTDETVRKQVDRLGTTEYSLAELVFEHDENVMVPMSEINEARRIATEMLNKMRLEAFAPPRKPRGKNRIAVKSTSKSNHSHFGELMIYADTLSKAEAALSAGADWLIFGGENFSQKVITNTEFEKVTSLVRNARKKLAIATPRIVKEGQLAYFEKQMGFFQKLEPDLLLIANNGLWNLAKRLDLKIPLWVDWPLNIFNGQSLNFWQEQGAAGATLSVELTMTQVEHLADNSPLMLECIVQGRLEMMVSEYCIAGSFLGDLHKGKCTYGCKESLFLQDRKEESFPIVTDQFCRMHILNAHDLSMLKYARQMAQSGIRRLRIDARFYSPEEITKIVSLYRRALDGDIQVEDNLAQTTRGHYFRGVL